MKSIFDIIEEHKADPQLFVWQKPAPPFNPFESLHKGILVTAKPSGALKLKSYVLTSHGLFKFKINGANEPVAFLKIDNARMERIEEREGMSGFGLVGHKGWHRFWCRSSASCESWLKSLSRVCVSLKLTDKYTLGKMLGKGTFAKVHLAWRKSDGKTFAVKTVEKSKILKTQRLTELLHNEISVMRQMNHPSIIKLYEVYENDLYIHLVIEYLKGGELFEKLQSRRTYNEKNAAGIIKCVLEALSYCHSLNIIHRDLKPENLIFA